MGGVAPTINFAGQRIINDREELKETINYFERVWRRGGLSKDSFALYSIARFLPSCAYHDEISLAVSIINMCSTGNKEEVLLGRALADAIAVALQKEAYDTADKLLALPEAVPLLCSGNPTEIEYLLNRAFMDRKPKDARRLFNFCDRFPEEHPALYFFIVFKDQEIRKELCAMLSGKEWPLLVKRELYSYIHWPANPRRINEFVESLTNLLASGRP